MKHYQKPTIETLDIKGVEIMTTSDPGDGPGATDVFFGWDDDDYWNYHHGGNNLKEEESVWTR